MISTSNSSNQISQLVARQLSPAVWASTCGKVSSMGAATARPWWLVAEVWSAATAPGPFVSAGIEPGVACGAAKRAGAFPAPG